MKILRTLYTMLLGLLFRLTGVQARRLRPLDFAPFQETLDSLTPSRMAEIDAWIHDTTIPRLQELMTDGQLSSEQLTAYFLARIRKHDPALSSIITLNPNALAEAREADALRKAGHAVGMLHGIPVTLKDNIETAAPMRTTAGAMVLADNQARDDAPIVKALRDAHAVILGKANLSEFAGAITKTAGVSAVGGKTINPHGAQFSPGGSSSGSAVSVSAALCVVSVGTETSGSLIVPASFNGVVGMKPSRDVVSGAGIVPLVRFQDSAGPLARNVIDAAILLSTIASTHTDYAEYLTASALQGVTVGVLRAEILSQKSLLEDTSDNEAVLARVMSGLAACGANPVDVAFATETGWPDAQSKLLSIVFGGLAHDTMDYLKQVGSPVNTVSQLQAYNLAKPRARIPSGQLFLNLASISAPDKTTYEKNALALRETMSSVLESVFASSDVQMLVSLSNCHSPLYATAGYPTITVPLGLRASGMPIGVTLIGRMGDDAPLLGYAYAFEQATKLRVTPTLA